MNISDNVEAVICFHSDRSNNFMTTCLHVHFFMVKVNVKESTKRLKIVNTYMFHEVVCVVL